MNRTDRLRLWYERAASRWEETLPIGNGSLGLETVTRIINHPQLRHLPFYLETPNDLAGYGREIALLRGAYWEEPRA